MNKKLKKGRRYKKLDQINAVDQDGIWNDLQRIDIPTYNPKKLVLTSFLQKEEMSDTYNMENDVIIY